MKFFTTKDTKTTQEEKKVFDFVLLFLGVLRVLGGKFFPMSVA